MQLDDLKTWINDQSQPIASALKELVEINTYTANIAGVDAGMDTLAGIAQDLGLATEVINARHRLIHAGHSQKKPRILLISHMDTVFPPDGDFLHYKHLEGGFVQGPGVGDIKGGIVIGLWSLLALSELCADFDVQMIISAEEEKGSPTLRDWYMSGQHGADYAIGLEPGFPQGELTPEVDLGVVYQRRGYGAMYWTAKGKSCHSGTPHLGLDAVESAARRIIDLKALNDPENGITLTVGMVNGGTAANTVADEVRATVSWRYEKMADGERIKAAIEQIFRHSYIVNPELGLSDFVDYTLDAFIPPMEHSKKNQKLIDIVLAQAKRLGQHMVPIARGGGSDANFVSAAGTPSICGMGAPAQGIHTSQETIYFPGLLNRIELLVNTLYCLLSENSNT